MMRSFVCALIGLFLGMARQDTVDARGFPMASRSDGEFMVNYAVHHHLRVSHIQISQKGGVELRPAHKVCDIRNPKPLWWETYCHNAS